MQAKTLGYIGERIAAEYLKRKGYVILKNNFTIKGGEIDLITKEGNTFVFVEVKTRSSDEFGYGDESIDRFKKNRIHRAIDRYFDSLKENDPDYRVDSLEIGIDPNTKQVLHIDHIEDLEF